MNTVFRLDRFVPAAVCGLALLCPPQCLAQGVVQLFQNGRVIQFGDDQVDVELQMEGQPQLVNMREQLKQNLGPLLEAEIYLARRIMQPTAEQRDEFVRLARQEFDKVVDRLARNQGMQQQALGMMGGLAGQADTESDPRSSIAEMLERVAKKCLSPEQAQSYREAVGRRVASTREATCGVLAEELGHRYRLSGDQKAKIAAALLANYQPTWYQAITNFLQHGEPFFPEIPDPFVTPHLNQDQLVAWRERNRHHAIMWGGAVAVLPLGQPAVPVKWNDDIPVDGAEGAPQP